MVVMRERRWAEMRRKFAGTFRKVGTTQRHVLLHLKSQPNSTVPSLSFPEFSSLLSLNCIVLVWLSRKAKAHSPLKVKGIWPGLKHSFSQMHPRLPFPSLFSCNNKECVCLLLAQLCLTLCDAMDWSLPGSSGHGIFQARILEWVAISFSRGSSWPRDQNWGSCIAGGFFTVWAPREAQ